MSNGAATNTATLGAKTFTVTATDVSGNTMVVTRSYTVDDPRPDGRVKVGSAAYRGNDVYNATGAGQTVSASAAVGDTVTYTVSLQNDAGFDDMLQVGSTASTTRFRVTYTVAGVDVTAQITDGTYTTARPPGTSLTIKVRVKVKPGTPAGATLAAKLKVRSTAVPTIGDTVGFTTRRS